jgi:hypothetical protein
MIVKMFQKVPKNLHVVVEKYINMIADIIDIKKYVII